MPFSCSAVDPIKQSLIEAGFGRIDINVVPQNKPADLSSFARAAVFGNPLLDQIKARGQASPADVVNDLTKAFREQFR